MIDDLINWLDERYTSIHNENNKFWMVHTWEYYGMTYGITLTLHKEVWTLKQMQESGYGYGQKNLIQSTDFKEVEPWLDVLQPTKDDFKFDRK